MKQVLPIIFLLLSCAKQDTTEPPIPPQNSNCTQCLRAGLWEGKITYTIPGLVENYTIPCPRHITHTSDSSYSVSWWSKPEAYAIVMAADTSHYTLELHKHNTSCGIQDTWLTFTSKAFLNNDTLHEAGNVEYKFYYNGRLSRQSSGTWKSWCVWVDD